MPSGSLNNPLEALDALGSVLRKGMRPDAYRPDPLKLAENVLILPHKDRKSATDRWRAPIQAEDWSEVQVLERCFGITPRMLKRAIYFGILRPGDHYRLIRKKKGGQGRGKILIQYNGERLLHLIPDIRLASRMKFTSWLNAVSRNAKKCVVSSKTKREIGEGIREATVLMQQLQRRLEDILRLRIDLEYKYRNILWETKDCPYCRGSSHFNGRACPMCDTLTRNETDVPLLHSSALDDLPLKTLITLHKEAVSALNRQDDEDIQWVVAAYEKAINRRGKSAKLYTDSL